MAFSKTKNDNPYIPNAPDSNADEVLTDVLVVLNNILEDSLSLEGKDDPFYQGLAFKNAYYAGGTLCLDTNKSVMVMLNITCETYTLQPIGDKKEQGVITNLMPIKLLWIAFFIYLNVKGKTEYYTECYNKSCIRHVYDQDMTDHSKANTLEEYFEKNLGFGLN